MLPAIEQESSDKEQKRQVEVLTYSNKVWLGIGQVNHKDTGIDRYTVELSKEAAKELIDQIKNASSYLGDEI